jgi:hypothetical protein
MVVATISATFTSSVVDVKVAALDAISVVAGSAGVDNPLSRVAELPNPESAGKLFSNSLKLKETDDATALSTIVFSTHLKFKTAWSEIQDT